MATKLQSHKEYKGEWIRFIEEMDGWLFKLETPILMDTLYDNPIDIEYEDFLEECIDDDSYLVGWFSKTKGYYTSSIE